MENINSNLISERFHGYLRGRLTLRGKTLRRKPWTSGEQFSYIFCLTLLMPAFSFLIHNSFSQNCLKHTERSATAHNRLRTHSFGITQSPVTF
jgi:hypothetical protein